MIHRLKGLVSRFRRGGNPDQGDTELVALARDLQASVTITSQVGWGFPDWVVGFRGLTILVERKSKRGKMRGSQVEFAAKWAGAWLVKIETAEELTAMLTARDIPAWLDRNDLRGERWKKTWKIVG